MSAPKVFISYSWTNPEHEKWVLELATDLRHNGVNATLDKWDLREGQDAFAFMEQMVTDKNISKVIIVSDKAYAEKSDARKGGAGTEAQIISAEIYAKRDQDKFVVAVTEFNEDGQPCVPTYYKSRIHINFSDPAKFTESFDQLLRWIADKPIYKKPELGKLPQYIAEPETAVTLATNAAKRRAVAAIKNGTNQAYPATKEYMELLIDELEKFRLPKDFDPLSDEILKNLESFIPYRDEFLEVVRTFAVYTRDDRYADLLHSFFENSLKYHRPPEQNNSCPETGNFKFIIHELFLHVGALLVSESRYSLFNVLLERPYYIASRAERGIEPMVDFSELRCYLHLFEHRNLKRVSFVADMIRKRSGGSGTLFKNLMQVDFLLFIRFDLKKNDPYYNWYPDTLELLDYSQPGFELFQRSQSAQHFETIRPLLGGATKKDLLELLKTYKNDPEQLPHDGFGRINPAQLMAFDKLCTLP